MHQRLESDLTADRSTHRSHVARGSRRLRQAAWLVAALVAGPAHAFVFTVGKSGLSNNCSFPTVQQALTAAARNPGPDEIWITRDVNGGYYQNQALVSPAQDVKIVGGFDDCWDTSPQGMTELHGNGGAAAPVLTINGGVVTIEKLRFTRGDAINGTTAAGGGIRFVGNGVLNITDSLIDRNNASMGGGIALLAQSGSIGLNIATTQIIENHANTVGGGVLLKSGAGVAAFTVWEDVDLSSNVAADGGGAIAMNSQSMLTMDGHRARIADNISGGDGGAILAVSPVIMHLSPVESAWSFSTFSGNEARNGGVLALADHPLLGASQGRSVVTITSRDNDYLNVMTGNHARERGGVIYVHRAQAPVRGDDVSSVCSWGGEFQGNTAGVSGTIVSVDGPGARFQNDPSCSATRLVCNLDRGCGNVANNVDDAGDGHVSEEGALFEVRNGAQMTIKSLSVIGNAVASLFAVRNSGSYPTPSLVVSQALVTDNTLGTVLSQCDGCLFEMNSSTVANNDLGPTVFGNGPFNFFLYDSIVDQPGRNLFASDPLQFGGTPVSGLLFSGFYPRTSDSLVFGRPTFNGERGNYTLRADSLGVDFAQARAGEDMYGRPRSVDLVSRPDGLGPSDLGALERQVDER
ncbi:MAG: hypothetical protein ACTHK2_11045 [Dokdonella sp.]|uniref:hypothetical protein n=1 Tax=Dokdonella sp. TaxID=2291710 RepID=UPI003F7F8119